MTSDDKNQAAAAASATASTVASAKSAEAAIIARILAGEKELFHDLIRPYERMVFLTAFSILKSELEAEDVAQETFISAYRHLNSFRGDSKFSTWLTTIAINASRQRIRKGKRAAFDSIEEISEESDNEFTPAFLTDWREVPLETLERKELREALRKAVAELPEHYRTVFTLRDLEEMNIQETAEALGINQGLVKVRLRRARIMLQKKLAPFLQTMPSLRKSWLGWMR